jgi:hypothetical protein
MMDVPHVTEQPQNHLRRGDTNRQAADDGQQKCWRNSPDGERIRCQRAQSQAINQQSRRVVQEALSLENALNAVWWPDVAQNRRCGSRIGWRDDRAERYGGGPRHGGHERANHHRYGHSGQDNADHHEIDQRYPVVFEVANRRVVGRIQQHGSNEERQGQTRLDKKRGRSRDERQYCTAACEKRRVRDAELARHRRQNHGGEQQPEESFELAHSVQNSP